VSRFDLLPDPSDHGLAEYDEWFETAERVADTLRASVVERDRANAAPFAEVELLRSSGLLTVGIPAAFGGAGLPWRATARIVRTIARTDASIAHILAYHYVWARYIATFETRQAESALRQTVADRWLWASPGSNRLGYPSIEPTDDGFVVHGASGFATGGPVADRLFAITIDAETNEMVIVLVDPSDPAVAFTGDWDVLGQRLSASRSITIDGLRVGEDRILRRFGDISVPQTPRQSVGVLHFQLTFGVLHLGIAEGALLEAVAYTRARTRPALHSTVERGRDEPYILNDYGAALAKVQAVSALVERAERALEWLYDLGDFVTIEQRAAVAEIIASAKVVSTDTVLEVTSGLFDLTGARSTDRAHGLDRFWRDARTLTLHDPVSYKRDELGQYFVNGVLPVPSGYR